MYQQVSLALTHGAYIGSHLLTLPLNPSPLAAFLLADSEALSQQLHPAITRSACVGRVLMAEHQVGSAPFGHVPTAKQATFQVAPRIVGRRLTWQARLL